MVASVFLFSFQNAIVKWLAQSYPIPMLVFFRNAVALAPSYMLVMRRGQGVAHQPARCPIRSGSD
jgi:hypothetical protein